MLIRDYAEKYRTYVVELRRKFHQYPEEGRKEIITNRMICEELRRMGLNPQTVCGTGIIVDIDGKADGGEADEKSGGIGRDQYCCCAGSSEQILSRKTACIRADIDGLQVQEETGVPYASKREGFMHACGHDAHIAMALTAARIIKDLEEQLKGRVRILFEPGEENSDGALDMIRAGALDGVDTIYGTHIWAGIPSGKFSAEAGPRMASTDAFTIQIEGKSTHGSLPHKGVDPIMTAASMISNIQLALGREFPATETALVSFCQIHGGSTNNVIPDQVTIGGTARAFLPEIRERIPEVMDRAIRAAAQVFGACAKLEYGVGTPPVINDACASKRAREAIRKNFGPDSLVNYPATTGGEDVSEYLNRVPGVFVFLGIDDEEIGAIYPNHNSHFTFDEKILFQGAVAAAQYCVDFLEESEKDRKSSILQSGDPS